MSAGVLAAILAAFFIGRVFEGSRWRPWELPPAEKPPELPPSAGPYRALPAPPTTAPECVLMVRHLRQGVQHVQSVIDAAMAELDDLEREAKEFARRTET